ncbi:MAG: diguanylate cyclase domain-containing protein [Oscillospiraceae bacterium]
MKRTKNNLITIIVLGIVLASILIGVIAVASFRYAIEKYSYENILHHCKENSENLNKRFSEIETLVHTLSDYYMERLDSADDLKNAAFLADYTEETSKIAYSLVRNNNSIVATYFRFNPEITNSTAGYFISRTAESSLPVYLEPTDLAKYDASDVQNVGWYYIAVEKGEKVWLEPYDNPNNGIYMISYVTPLYLGDTLIGILGIDLDYDAICNEVGSISLYESGYAILMDKNGKVLYSGDHNPVLPSDTVQKLVSEDGEYLLSSYVERQQLNIAISHELRNGEYLALIVPEREIYSTRNRMTFTIILIAIAVSTMVILVLTGMVNRIMNDTRTDKLTGAKNRNAYLEKIDVIENEMRTARNFTFAVLVFDINGLKTVNDNIGHAEGDRLIINSYNAIKSKFSGYDLYRIGGDEFVIFVEKRTAASAQILAEEFRSTMSEKHPDYSKSPDEATVSCGFALYNPETDASCEDVFNRADRDMYADKEKFYAANPHLKRRV